MNLGIHSTTVGDFTVTAINDGLFAPPLDIVTGVEQETAAATLVGNFRPSPPVITISAFLVKHPGGLALVDAGSGDKFGPGHGYLVPHLASLGVSPADIDTILLTHVHTDHAGGLTDPNWQPVFPNAEIVLGTVERDYWLDETRPVPESQARGKALALGSLNAYPNRLRGVTDGGEGLPGVRLLMLPGHTPGHAGWLLSSGNDSLLIWGDVVHMAGLQFQRPEATVIYDVDPALARASRSRAFDLATTDRIRVAGQHLDFPTFGHVEKRTEGYGFVADAWLP